MRRTDLLDTKPEAYRILLARLRELTPEQRQRMVFDRIEMVRLMRKQTEHLRPPKDAE